ncbi:MAG: pilus assembly protein [Actinobacteria bacterium]|nr:pilus assembly protein [Actinomycetota bacterium]
MTSRADRPFSHHRRSVHVAGVPGRTRELGVAIVEATFVFIIFFTLVVAVFEGGLYMKDDLAVSSSVRAGARAASAVANENRADLYTIVNLSREATALSRNDIVRIVIYKPSGFGEAPSATCKAGTPVTGVCNVYTAANMTQAEVQVKEEAAALAEGRAPDPSKIVFGCLVDSPDRYWCPDDRKVSQTGTGPDYVGVWMRVEHKWVTKIFGNAKTIEDHSVVRIEPRDDSA